MHLYPLVDAGGGACRAAGRIQHLHVDGAIGGAVGKQPALQLRLSPADPQDPKKLRRQHHGAILAAHAMTNEYDAATAGDIADLQPDGLRGAKTRYVVSAVRVFRLGTASRKWTTSSALRTTGSVRGERA